MLTLMRHPRCSVPLVHRVGDVGLREASMLLTKGARLPDTSAHLHSNILHLHLYSLRLLLLLLKVLLLESGDLLLRLVVLAKDLRSAKKRGSARVRKRQVGAQDVPWYAWRAKTRPRRESASAACWAS